MARADNGCEILAFGPYQLMPSKRLLLREDKPVNIGGRAFDILVLLVREAGRVVVQRKIFEHAWPGVTVEPANLRFQIAKLRRALSDECEGAYIRNVRGQGYIFVAGVRRECPSGALVNADVGGTLTANPPRLIGRDADLDRIKLLVERNRLTSIVGPGGVGKTALTIALARELAASFGLFYVDLSSVKESTMVLPAVATVVNADCDDLLRKLTVLAAARSPLLLLDCCEHVIDGVAALSATIFQLCPAVHIVVTSREPLRADGEAVYLLQPLALPLQKQKLTACDVAAAPAVRLFIESAKAAGYPIDLQDKDAAAVATICRRLDGIPLALELASSRVVTYGMAGLAEVLNDQAILYWRGRRREPRHRTLEAMLDWSFRLLSELGKRVLTRLSVFPGTFTMRDAQVAASGQCNEAEVGRAIEELADKSLITIQEDGECHRYKLLAITKLYCEVKLIGNFDQQQGDDLTGDLHSCQSPGRTPRALVGPGHQTSARGFGPHFA